MNNCHKWMDTFKVALDSTEHSATYNWTKKTLIDLIVKTKSLSELLLIQD